MDDVAAIHFELRVFRIFHFQHQVAAGLALAAQADHLPRPNALGHAHFQLLALHRDAQAAAVMHRLQPVSYTHLDVYKRQPYGNVATAGLVATADLPTTVMPFIIRGVSLLGVASAGTARDIRDDIWRHLADDWKPAHLETICQREITLDGLPEVFAGMLSGQSFGRTLVKTS